MMEVFSYANALAKRGPTHGEESHIFSYSPYNGHVLHFARFACSHEEANGSWSFIDLSDQAGAPIVSTQEKVVSIFGSANSKEGHDIFYKGTEGHLHHLFYRLHSGKQWEHQLLADYPKVKGNSSISCLSIAGESVRVFYVSEDNGHVLQLTLATTMPTLSLLDVTESAGCKMSADNLTAQVLNDKDLGIFFTGEDLHAHRFKFEADSGRWIFEENIYKRPVARNRYSILSMCCFVTERKDGHMLFVGSDNHIHEVYQRKGKWIHKDLTEDTEGTPEASRHHPIMCLAMKDSSTHIYFVSGEEEYFTLHSLFWTEENDSWKTSQMSDTCWQPSEGGDDDDEASNDGNSSKTLGPLGLRVRENDRVTIMGSFKPKQNVWAFLGDATSVSEGTYEMIEIKEIDAKGKPVDRNPAATVDTQSLLNATHGVGKGKGRKSVVSESEVSTENLKLTKLQPMYYSKKKAIWKPMKKRERAAGIDITALKFVTFNVLFNKVLGDIRQPALLELVHKHQPDVIAFQEADLPFLTILLNTPWVRENYYLSDTEGKTIRPYGCLLLSRIPWTHLYLHELPTKLGRKVVYGEFNVSMEKADVRKIAIATSHLESYPQDKPIRRLQLVQITDLLKDADEAVMMGDFNFADKTENQMVDPAYADLWLTLHPTEEGFTFNYRENELTKVLRSYEICRYDRVYLRSKDGVWQPKSVEVIGKEPIVLPPGTPIPTIKGIEVPKLFPSDHFGLCAVITKNEK